LIIIDAHAIDQLAPLMARVAQFEHGVASQLILEISAVVLHVSVGVIAIVAAGAASYVSQQSAGFADRRNQAIRIRIAIEILRVDAVAALAERPWGGR